MKLHVITSTSEVGCPSMEVLHSPVDRKYYVLGIVIVSERYMVIWLVFWCSKA